MLEDLLENDPRGKLIRQGSPSSEKLLGDGSPLDILIETANTKLEEIKEDTRDTTWRPLAKKATATAGQSLLYTGAGTLELASRLSEKFLRSATRATGETAMSAYNGVKQRLSKENQSRLDGLEAAVTEATDQIRTLTKSDTRTGKAARGLGHLATISASLLVAGAVVYTTLNRSEERHQNYRNQETEEAEPLPVDDLEHFDDIDNILVYVDNSNPRYDERQYILENVRHYKQTVDHRSDLIIDEGTIDKITDPSQGRTWYVVEQNEQIPDVLFDMGQLRGHTSSMEHLLPPFMNRMENIHEQHDTPLRRLYNDAVEAVTGKRMNDEHIFVYFGGCNSHQFIAENVQDNIALAGKMGVADGSHNTWAMLKLPQLLQERELAISILPTGTR